jgi:hypothetical protein
LQVEWSTALWITAHQKTKHIIIIFLVIKIYIFPKGFFKKEINPVSGYITLFVGIIAVTPTCLLFFENSLNLQMDRCLKAYQNSKTRNNNNNKIEKIKIILF